MQLFSSKKTTNDGSRVSTLVSHTHDRKAGAILPLSQDEKMLCALRKVLAQMTDDCKGTWRYYIDGPECVVTDRNADAVGKAGEPGTYSASGRMRIGIITTEGVMHQIVAFQISFRDTKDDRGLADVEWFDPTTIDEMPGVIQL